jgi:branched-chain amino acid aminotransferase
MAELQVYLNGRISEEKRALISPFDRGFLWGDGVYEITPCFDGRLYRLQDHLERLFRSLRYVQIDPGLDLTGIEEATLALLEANRSALEAGNVYRVGHWITRGMEAPSGRARDAGPATILIFFNKTRIELLARSVREGVSLTVVPTRRVPPQCLETRAKVTSKMNQILAELDADASGRVSLMLDLDGNVAENATANFFLVRAGELWTPPARNILEGVTRKAVFEIAARLGIPCRDATLTRYDLLQAEEWFLSSSLTCAVPVREVDGVLPLSPVPGPVTRRLMKAFGEETGFDFFHTPVCQ